MAISINRRNSEIPDEIYQAIEELGSRPDFDGNWLVSVAPSADGDDWQLKLESRGLRAPDVDLAPEHQSPSGVRRALHSMLDSLEEEN